MNIKFTDTQKKILKTKETVNKIFCFEADRDAYKKWKEQNKPFWENEEIRDFTTYASMGTNAYTGHIDRQLDSIKWYALIDKMAAFLECADFAAQNLVERSDFPIPEVEAEFEKTRKECLEIYKEAAEIEFLALEPECLICFDYTGHYECPEGLDPYIWNSNLYRGREAFINNLKNIPEGLQHYKQQLFKDARQKLGLQKLNELYPEWAKLQNFAKDIDKLISKYDDAINKGLGKGLEGLKLTD